MADLKPVSVNSVHMTARLTRDIEIKNLPSGTTVGEVGVAYSERYFHNDEWKEKTFFFEVKLWGKTAENAAKQCVKGNFVYIQGAMEQESWTKEGKKHSVVKIRADKMHSLQWNAEKVKGGAYRKETGTPDEDMFEPDVPESEIPF